MGGGPRKSLSQAPSTSFLPSAGKAEFSAYSVHASSTGPPAAPRANSVGRVRSDPSAQLSTSSTQSFSNDVCSLTRGSAIGVQHAEGSFFFGINVQGGICMSILSLRWYSLGFDGVSEFWSLGENVLDSIGDGFVGESLSIRLDEGDGEW